MKKTNNFNIILKYLLLKINIKKFYNKKIYYIVIINFRSKIEIINGIKFFIEDIIKLSYIIYQIKSKNKLKNKIKDRFENKTQKLNLINN